MNTDSLDTKYGLFWYVVLEHYLRGLESPKAIAKELGLDEVPDKVRYILNEQAFRLAVYEARKRPADAAIKFVTQNLMTYAQQMHGLALDDTDKRTKLTALKDLMDRGGMGAAQKIDIKSPSAYRAATAALLEDDLPTPPPDEATMRESPAAVETEPSGSDQP